MRSRAPGRRALLFLSALTLPCLVLIAMGVYAIGVGEELATTKQQKEQAGLVDQIQRDLLARVERIKFEEAAAVAKRGRGDLGRSPGQPQVALVGWMQDGGRLVLPWDVDPAIEQFNSLRHKLTPYARALAEAERFEHVSHEFAEARGAYRRAKVVADTPLERDYATLLLAGVSVKCSCEDDAVALYRELLDSEAIDDQGVPLAFYAAGQLLELNQHQSRVLSMLERHASLDVWVSPTAAYFERSLIATLIATLTQPGDKSRTATVAARHQRVIADVERALALQRAFPTLAKTVASDRSQSPSWTPFGDSGEWLVGVAPALAGLPPLAIAIKTEAMTEEIRRTPLIATSSGPGVLHLSTDLPGGVALGPSFPGLRVETSPVEVMRAWIQQRTFYIAALLVVVTLTTIGGFLFWRDVRRELRVAEMRSQFVASVSHELRTPLTAIRMFAETLQMERPLDRSARGEYLDTIVNESERLTRLINNVLDFSKIERGEKVYHREPASLATVVRNAAGAMRYPLAHQGFDLHVEVADDAPVSLRVDQDAMQQAILNLISNAMKYSRDRREIMLTLARVNGDAVIAVTDYGLGIPLSEHRRIFERFYRAQVQENGRIPGAGLGLALVDHIVKGHGGHVEVESTVGQGSTFAIHLPVGV